MNGSISRCLKGRYAQGHKNRPDTQKRCRPARKSSEPDYGALLDDMFFHDGGDIPHRPFIVPRIEVELAFVLAKPLRPSLHAVRRLQRHGLCDSALERLTPATACDPETQRPRKVFDTISDNAANAGDPRWSSHPNQTGWICAGSPLLYRNGVIEETGVAAGVLIIRPTAWRGWRCLPPTMCQRSRARSSSAARSPAGAGAAGATPSCRLRQHGRDQLPVV